MEYSIFTLEETERSSRLRQIMDSFGFTYLCLWSHFPNPSNCLIFIDGIYKEENNLASSSSGSLAMRYFVDYQKSIFLINDYNGGVPGFAFMHNLPYMERKGLELLSLASNSTQLRFYEEARIKTAIFMGCKNGEIEIGLSNGFTQINFEMVLSKLFPGDFPQELLPQPLDQTRPSSSSSSLRSLSMDNSGDYSPFLFNMLQTSSYTPERYAFQETFLDPKAPSSTMRSSQDPLQQALNQMRTQSIPSREDEESLMTKAILAALSSSSPSPSSSPSKQLHPPRVPSVFTRYRSCLGTNPRVESRQNLNNRSLSFFKNLSAARTQQGQMNQTTRPTSNQLHHMIAERKRREKFNEGIQVLRSLLPPGTKVKDKVSVLLKTNEYISSLKSQVMELERRNKILEAEHSRKEALNQDSGNFSGERLAIRITDIGESSLESRVVDLELNVRGESILVDLVARLLEFMKQVDQNVTVMSVEAGTRTLETEGHTNRVVLRLRIQGRGWDRSSFQEAVSRVLDDLAQ